MKPITKAEAKKKLEDISLMIENEILYRYDNLEKALDSANVVSKQLESFLDLIYSSLKELKMEEKKIDEGSATNLHDMAEEFILKGKNLAVKEINQKIDNLTK